VSVREITPKFMSGDTGTERREDAYLGAISRSIEDDLPPCPECGKSATHRALDSRHNLLGLYCREHAIAKISADTRPTREAVIEKRVAAFADYAVALQRAIEYHCKGESVPESIARECPWHARMLDAALGGQGEVERGCSCRGVETGSYLNQVVLHTPSGKVVGLDACIAAEIQELWERGVQTVGSCCGHGDPTLAIIMVEEGSVRLMQALGYTPHPHGSSCFAPKFRRMSPPPPHTYQPGGAERVYPSTGQQRTPPMYPESLKDIPAGTCELCGQPMPPGEEMFRFHGYSGPCPEATP
jgi:hypothetical protein